MKTNIKGNMSKYDKYSKYLRRKWSWERLFFVKQTNLGQEHWSHACASFNGEIPLLGKCVMLGSSTGSWSSGTGTAPHDGQWMMGIGVPQYLWRDMSQSLSLVLVMNPPALASSSCCVTFWRASSGHKPLSSPELIILLFSIMCGTVKPHFFEMSASSCDVHGIPTYTSVSSAYGRLSLTTIGILRWLMGHTALAFRSWWLPRQHPACASVSRAWPLRTPMKVMPKSNSGCAIQRFNLAVADTPWLSLCLLHSFPSLPCFSWALVSSSSSPTTSISTLYPLQSPIQCFWILMMSRQFSSTGSDRPSTSDLENLKYKGILVDIRFLLTFLFLSGSLSLLIGEIKHNLSSGLSTHKHNRTQPYNVHPFW